MTRPRPMQRGSSWLIVLALVTGCSGRTPYAPKPLSVDTLFLPEISVEDCSAVRDPPELRVWDVHTEHGAHSFVLLPTDEPWLVELSPAYDGYRDLQGFEARLECGPHAFPLELLECDTTFIRVLLIPAQQLPEAGSPDQPCRLRFDLRNGDDWWLGYERAVVLRRGLVPWYESTR